MVGRNLAHQRAPYAWSEHDLRVRRPPLVEACRWLEEAPQPLFAASRPPLTQRESALDAPRAAFPARAPKAGASFQRPDFLEDAGEVPVGRERAHALSERS